MDTLKFDYHVWATERVLDHLENEEEDLISKQITSVFNTIWDLLLHMYTVDQLWYSRILNQVISTEENLTSFSDLRIRYAALHTNMLHVVQQLPSDTVITYSNSKGERFSNELIQIVDHIANHGTYHRGNLSAMLHQLDRAGVSTDYIYYLRELLSPRAGSCAR